jgi:type I restriction enzyme, S subunit
LSETLPEGWVLTTLGELSIYVTSGSRDWSKYYSDHGALFIRTQDINQNKLTSVDEIARVALPKQVEGKRTLVTQGDLLITITGANVGKCAHVDIPLPEAYVSQSVALVRLAKGFGGRYVQRQLISPGADDERTPLQQSAYGVGRPVLNLDNVRDAPIVLAPFSEQQRIVAKIDKLLSQVDSACNRLSRVSAIFKRFRQAALAAACSGRLTQDWRDKNTNVEDFSAQESTKEITRNKRRAGRLWGAGLVPELTDEERRSLPDVWTWKRVKDLGQDPDETVQVGPMSMQSKDFAASGVPVLNVGCVQWGCFDESKLDYMPPDIASDFERYRIEKGDVLFTRSGTVGRCAVASDKQNKYLMTFHLLRVRCDARRCLPEYLQMVFQGAKNIRRQTEAAAIGSTRAGFNTNLLANLDVPLPPLPEQREIVRVVNKLFHIADSIEKQVAEATVRSVKVTQSILAKAFRGELVPTEAELARREGRDYEPASVLLERIRKERESQVSSKPERKRPRTKKKLPTAKG